MWINTVSYCPGDLHGSSSRPVSLVCTEFLTRFRYRRRTGDKRRGAASSDYG